MESLLTSPSLAVKQLTGTLHDSHIFNSTSRITNSIPANLSVEHPEEGYGAPESINDQGFASPWIHENGDNGEPSQNRSGQSTSSQPGNYSTLPLCEPEPPATDSGYASIGRQIDGNKYDEQEDARTVYTDNQDLQVPEDVKERLISAFATELLRQIQDVQHNVNGNDLTWNRLAELLKEFSFRLSTCACSSEQKRAITFIRHFRNRVANSFVSLLRSSVRLHEEQVDDEDEERISQKEDKISAAEKFKLWNVEQPDPSTLQDGIPEIDQDNTDDQEDEDYAIARFPEAWRFLTGSHAYQCLLSKMRVELQLTKLEGTQAETIKRKISEGIVASRTSDDVLVESRFYIEWDLLGFRKANYQDEQKLQLGSLITIVGSGEEVQALTCAEYLIQVWPITGPETLSALQGALDQGEERDSKVIMADRTQITLKIKTTIVVAVVIGTETAISEIGQQLAWLGAALRPSPSEYRMAYSSPLLTCLPGKKVSRFKLNFQVTVPEPEVAQRNGFCWISLFRNPIIVQGYPILARANAEKGLEIPLNMMAGSSGALRATTFNGGVVIKGFSTMCCPTRRVKNSVLWHYLFNHDGNRMSYLSADILCGGRLLSPEVDVSCLARSRNFLGWASSVEIHVGTKDVRYDDIDWAGSKFASPGVALDNFHIAAGKFITGGASFIRGQQDTPIHLSHARRPYELEIHNARNMKVIMYDVKDRRGWLVDGTSALLHLSRTQLSSSPYSDSELFKLEDFQHADQRAGILGAKKALLDRKNRELLLFEDSRTTTEYQINTDAAIEQQVRRKTRRWTYEDLVRDTYHILEQIEDRQLQMMTSPAVSLPFKGREKLLGFGFMDIVDGQNVLLPRVATLKRSGWGWVDFSRSIKAIAILGKGFGEMIRPAENSNALCKFWNQVPEGKDCLVACISTLKEISRQHGDSDSEVVQLANGAYWYKPDKLFESCNCKSKCRKAGCDRVQVLLPRPEGSTKPGNPFDSPSGAVIFGKSRKLPWSWPSRGESVAGEQSETEDEEEGSDFHDSALGRTSSTTSDRDAATNLTLSPSDRSPLNDASTLGRDMAEFHERQATERIASSSGGTKSGSGDALMVNSESTKTFQIISRGVKRTLDKVTPQALSRKKQNTGSVENEGEQVIHGDP